MKLNNLFSVSNKNLIVTGGDSGIGFEISKSLIFLKANVIRVDLKFSNKIGSTDYVCDLRSRNQVVNLFRKIKKKFKTVDGLVNCAGVSLSCKNPYNNKQYYENTLNSNLNSVFFVSAEACKIIKKNKGSVVNITSLGAELAFPDNPAYQISKAGLKQLTKAFARDYAKFRIRFNNICPGYIKSKMTIKSYKDHKKRKIRTDKTLLKCWGQPSDLVGATIFLLSDASSYITGSDIYVDGGWTSKGI